MCGIAGFVSTVPLSGAVTNLARMTEVLRHRGPDDFGFYHDDFAHLGHRRLSIVDLAAGRQPISNKSGALWIIYNGETYNHAELRRSLERNGHRYRTRSDTESILHAYEQYGPECLALFRGMFAFAIWDRTERVLFCARDRLGVKPLYYYWDGQLFAFASEIKALLEHAAISPDLDEAMLPEVLAFGYTNADRTLFRGIRALMPGHHLTLDLKRAQPGPRIGKYWDVPVAGDSSNEVGCTAETRRRLDESVRMRMMSDVPLGIFLSGGLDSSVIAALATQASDQPAKTFSVGYREAPFSELQYASHVARSLGTEHREIVIGRDEFFNALPRLIWHEDEPLAWPSSVSLYFVSKLASQHVKVVLSGEGSDELFAGYERYRWHLFNERAAAAYQRIPAPLRRRIGSLCAASPLLGCSLRRKLKHTFLTRDATLESLLLDNFYATFSQEECGQLLAGGAADAYAAFLRYCNPRPASSSLSHLLYADQKTYLVALLMKQDRMSMAASIESRVPFLDHTLVEFAAGIPDRLKIRGGTQKYVLKKAAADLLPRKIVYRKKMGFPTPLRHWLRGPEAEPLYKMLRAREGLLAAYLDVRHIDVLIARHQSGLEDATDRIWRLVNLQIWGDLFLTGRRAAVMGGRDALPVAV